MNNANNYYIYVMINKEQGTPFYIGKDNESQYVNIKCRSKKVLQIWRKYDCEIKIIVDGLSKKEAVIMERYIKAAYKEIGSPIVDYDIDDAAEARRIGIASAKANGKHLGRPKTARPDNWESIIAQWKSGEITAIEAARQTGVSSPTFYRMAKEK